MKKMHLICFLTLFLFLPVLHAQDTITEVTIKRIYISKHPQDPAYPQFVIYSKSSNFQLGFGGYVKLTGAFDFNGIVDSYDFITYDIPVENRNLGEKRIYFDAHQSRMYAEILGQIKGKSMRIYIETDFYSEHYYPRLRHAYGQYGSFLIGQTWSTLMDLDAMPNTVDFEGPNSAVSLRAPMIRYSKEISKGFRLSTAVELPEVSMTYRPPWATETYQYVPDIILSLRLANKKAHVQVGGLFRTMAYQDTTRSVQKKVYGYGGVISGKLHFTKSSLIMFQGVYGTGIAKYIQDIYGVGLDAIWVFDKYNRELTTVPSYGCYLALQQYWHPKVNSTFVYSYTGVRRQKVGDWHEYYKFGHYVTVNLFWKVLPNLSVAIEYLWGQRSNYDDKRGNANRVNGMVQFNF